MGDNRNRRDPRRDPVDDGTWDEEMAEAEAVDDEAVDDEAVDGAGAPDREAPDREGPDREAPDRGYEIDLDEHSPVDLDEAIQDAMAAVERAGQGSTEAPHTGADGGNGAPAAPEVAKLQERLLRTLADFDNYRKRTDREKQSLRRLGVMDVMRDALSISDNLERALESPGGIEDLKQGVRMILRQHQEFLRRHGVEGFESMGERFDPAVHEAVATQQSSEIEEPMVSEQLQKGYHFHDQLLRPALVYVAMPSAAPAKQSSAAAVKQSSAAPAKQSAPKEVEGAGKAEEAEEAGGVEEVEGRQGD